MAVDIKKLAEQAAKKGRDFTKTVAGGGEYTPPEAGPVNLRFVGYYEIGEQKKKFKGVEEYKNRVQLVFELSGPKYPARDGVPMRITITETLSNNEKANIVKLFKKMNYKGEATHFAQLLGEAYRGRIYHSESEKDGVKRVYANLRNEDGYSITPPVIEVVDEEGNVSTKPVKVAPVMGELKMFLWDMPSKEMWDSIYIDGEYPEVKDEKTGKVTRQARSKNVIQLTIMGAKNWIGSPMQVLLDEGEPDVGEDDSVEEAVAEAKKTAGKPAKKPAAAAKKKKPEPEPEPEQDAPEESDGDDDDPLNDIE